MLKDNRKLHLLVVEDNMGDYVLVEEYLSEHFSNYSLSHARTAAKAADKLLYSDLVFNVILLDLTLPDNSGESLIREIMKISDNIPVIVLTGYSDLSFSVKSLSLGVSDYLLKDDLTAFLLHKSITYSIERNIFSGRTKASEKNYRDLFELTPEPMMLFDLDTFQFLNVNQAAIISYGYTKEEFLSMKLMDIKPTQEIENAKKIIRDTIDAKNIKLEGEHRHIKKNGDVIIVEIHASTIDYYGKKARVCIVRDVTAKRLEEERLKLLESVITNSNEAVIILEGMPDTYAERKIYFVNDGFKRLTGYTSDFAVGKTLNFLYGDKTDQKKIEQIRKIMLDWQAGSLELIAYRNDGSHFWIDISLVPVTNAKGEYSNWVLIGRDISDTKIYQEDLKESLRDKEILLSEIHHRVKNNLAVVSGMLQLQAEYELNDEVTYKLYDSITRIQTMATIHELLYQSGSFSNLIFSDIIQKLIDSVKATMGSAQNIDVNIIKKPIRLNINQAIPCSLIANEVITNIFKHAFPHQNSGEIHVNLDESNDIVFLTIKDNGIGLPENFHDIETNTLGKKLISILTQQLGAKYNLYGSDNGTIFELEFTKSNIRGSGSSIL